MNNAMTIAKINTTKLDLVILIPIFNDWVAFGLLIPRLRRALGPLARSSRVLVIDDGSSDPPPGRLEADDPGMSFRIDVLSLRRNVGHQRAIAIGLCYIAINISCCAVLVMDGDGQDKPEDAPRLYRLSEAEHHTKVVFAERTRRSESLFFCAFYRLYRVGHRILTGIPVRVGNFSVVPFRLLMRLVVVSEMWNHYAASVFKAQLPILMLPTTRGARLGGQSGMNFVGLAVHGLSALSVFADRVGVRLLVATTSVSILFLAALITTLVIRLFTPWAIPAWATYASGILLILVLQLSLLALVFVFITLEGRGTATFIPIRDYVHFVSGVHSIEG